MSVANWTPCVVTFFPVSLFIPHLGKYNTPIRWCRCTQLQHICKRRRRRTIIEFNGKLKMRTSENNTLFNPD